MLIAAWTVIARNWRKTVCSSMADWVCKMNKMKLLERMILAEVKLSEYLSNGMEAMGTFSIEPQLIYYKSSSSTPLCNDITYFHVLLYGFLGLEWQKLLFCGKHLTT